MPAAAAVTPAAAAAAPKARAKSAAATAAAAEALWPTALPAAVAPSAWVAPLSSVRVVVAGSVVLHSDSEESCVVHARFPFPSTTALELGRLSEPLWAWRDDGDIRLRTHPRFLYRVAVLLENSAKNRLYRRLRDALGTSYDAGIERGEPLFPTTLDSLGASCTPLASEAPQALAHLLDCVAGLLSGRDPLTRGEFEEAVRPVRATLPSDERTNAYWVDTLLTLHAHGSSKRLSSHHDKVRFYNALTYEDMLAGASAIAAALPVPLPAHVVVGVSGGMSFEHARSHARAGAGAGASAGAGSGAGASAGAGTGGRSSRRSRDPAREWAAVLSCVHACDREIVAGRVAKALSKVGGAGMRAGVGAGAGDNDDDNEVVEVDAAACARK